MRPRTRALIFSSAVAFALFGGALCAQGGIVSVRVFADADGAQIMIDGVYYQGPATLLWPEGSKHILSANPVQNQRQKTTFVLKEWSTNLGPISELSPAITADRDLTYVKASFDTLYAVSLSFYACAGPDAGCPAASPGRVYINKELFTQSAERYYKKGEMINLEAYPNAGFVFQGWSPLPGLATTSNAFQLSFPLMQPQTAIPMFRPAVALQVTIDTSPPGLKILADRSPMIAPFSIDWGIDSAHTLGTFPDQYDSYGHLWVFDSWSDGGAINHDFNMVAGSNRATVTAKFVPGVVVTFQTDPPLLKLRIENRDNWPSYTFRWAPGTTHPVSAPLEQTDAKGRKYRFQGWSDGQPAAYDYTVASAPPDVRMMATYKAVGQITVSSLPAGMQIRVDGQNCVTPCNIERDAGTAVRISAPELYAPNDASRWVFQGWSDGGGAEHNVTAPEVPLRLEASYREQNRLAVSMDPPNLALCRISPEASDGFYEKGALVTIQVDPQPGSRFVSWDGDFAGTRRTAVVEMNAPKRVFARLEAVPYVPPSGVRNGAAETPVDAVAPGSIISILGVNFAPGIETSPDNPLAQTLTGVTVRIGDRLLPLAMVSPGEIRAQLLSDIEIGAQRLAVRCGDKPEVTADFQVARNAPGLFFKEVEGRQFAVAVRENGEPLAPGASVRNGETITIFGTGLGPYYRTPPDGFALPEVPEFRLADPVEVVVGDAVVTPVYAGTATQAAGLNAVRFRVPESNAAADLQVVVRVNGVESNSVLLRTE